MIMENKIDSNERAHLGRARDGARGERRAERVPGREARLRAGAVGGWAAVREMRICRTFTTCCNQTQSTKNQSTQNPKQTDPNRPNPKHTQT